MHAAKTTVLIIDDSALIRRHVVQILSELKGIRIVGEAADAAEGLELARKLRPDVVTLDVRMPGASGLTVVAQIKQVEPSPIVMVLTNYPYPTYRKRATEAGADFFFDKSTEFHKVLVALRNGFESAGPSDPNQIPLPGMKA